MIVVNTCVSHLLGPVRPHHWQPWRNQYKKKTVKSGRRLSVVWKGRTSGACVNNAQVATTLGRQRSVKQAIRRNKCVLHYNTSLGSGEYERCWVRGIQRVVKIEEIIKIRKNKSVFWRASTEGKRRGWFAVGNSKVGGECRWQSLRMTKWIREEDMPSASFRIIIIDETSASFIYAVWWQLCTCEKRKRSKESRKKLEYDGRQAVAENVSTCPACIWQEVESRWKRRWAGP